MYCEIMAYYILQMILATCVLSMAATLELKAESAPDVSAEYSELFSSGLAILRDYPGCTSQGVFAINCTSYMICISVNGGILGGEGTCPSQQNFDPNKKECSSSYVCPPSCIAAGFICPNSTSFTLCAAAGLTVVEKQTCPNGYFCNQKCTFPCVGNILNC
jgi:hypothetical protein